MANTLAYAPASVWDTRYANDAIHGTELNPDGHWTSAWLPILARYNVQSLLDLGCGTGSDSLAIARQGIRVVGLDYSYEAIRRAQMKATDPKIDFLHSFQKKE